jgi:hypothetical protein
MGDKNLEGEDLTETALVGSALRRRRDCPWIWPVHAGDWTYEVYRAGASQPAGLGRPAVCSSEMLILTVRLSIVPPWSSRSSPMRRWQGGSGPHQNGMDRGMPGRLTMHAVRAMVRDPLPADCDYSASSLPVQTTAFPCAFPEGGACLGKRGTMDRVGVGMQRILQHLPGRWDEHRCPIVSATHASAVQCTWTIL